MELKIVHMYFKKSNGRRGCTKGYNRFQKLHDEFQSIFGIPFMLQKQLIYLKIYGYT